MLLQRDYIVQCDFVVYSKTLWLWVCGVHVNSSIAKVGNVVEVI